MSEFLCRACGHSELESFLDLGETPLSNAMVPFEKSDIAERFYPLHAFICPNCFLAQLGEFESPENIFDEDYTYYSSFSEDWLKHASSYAETMKQRFSLGSDAHISEVASNDGYLLRWFADDGFKVTGIEPAEKCAQAARNVGVTTVVEFFGQGTAAKIAADRGRADLMVANNVLAHVPNLMDFVAGFKEMLKPEGVVTFEFPHLMNLLALNQFDTIYHEHFSYLALRPVMNVLESQGLRVFDVEEWPTHGGSLRVFACHQAASHACLGAVGGLLQKENEAGLYNLDTYAPVQARVGEINDAIWAFLRQAQSEGKSVVGYGAAAKGATFLNYCGIGPDQLGFVVDKNPKKQECYMPGVKIPVYAVERLVDENPDYVLILPWNIRKEAIRQLRALGVSSKFVTAIPKLEIWE